MQKNYVNNIDNYQLSFKDLIVDNSHEFQYTFNTSTGEKNYLYYRLKESFKKADRIDIIVSFLMESGIKMIKDDIKEAIERGASIRILTGSYLNITQPSALYMIKREFKDKIDLRFYNVKHKSFHPKSYIFHNKSDSEIYIGSSNISKGALTDSVEWNYRFLKSQNEDDFNGFFYTFEDLFNNHSQIIDDEVLSNYSKAWRRPQVFKDIERESDNESKDELIEKEIIDFQFSSQRKMIKLFEPRGAQVEALYELEKSREEGFDKAIVVAATGIGKTYLSAFDSENFSKVLFVAHREEIIKQAAESFKNVRNSNDIGYFYNKIKDTDKTMIFALTQTLGKEQYLNQDYFKSDYFDYIVIDEFHHAVSESYKNIINYFKPKFLLGLTATPERLDSRDVFSLCDYNTVYEIRLQQAINQGYLVPFRYYGIYDESVDYSEIKFKNGKYDDLELEKSLSINKRGKLILDNYKKYKSKRALAFCSSKGHAEYMAEYFTGQGIKCASVYSGELGIYAKDRRKAIKELIDGDINVIFSVDMFNEGLDIPSIDMVMFLRPTQSPTVFLQQLGRGLRKFKNKKYLNVLDFIGNYKKADLIPFLLTGKKYSASETKRGIPDEEEFPEDCRIDFDFRLIDIFRDIAGKELKIKDKVLEEFKRIKEELGHRPSRVELFRNMDYDIYNSIKRKKALNPLSNYLEYLKENNELNEEDELLYNSRGREFINMIETTSMSKSYKMPVLLAFYNNGNVKTSLSDEDIYKSFKEFYIKGSNKVDMIRHKATRDFESWGRKEYIKLAKTNPIKFLLKTEHEFFKEKEDGSIALQDDIKEIIKDKAFKEHMIDAINFRTDKYYVERNFKED